jgi:hypothetical protein
MNPLTGRKLYLRESTTNEAEAQRILRRLTARVDEQRHAKTNASFRTATEAWLRTHEVEETTRASYEMYAPVHLYPAFGDEPIGKPLGLDPERAELRPRHPEVPDRDAGKQRLRHLRAPQRDTSHRRNAAPEQVTGPPAAFAVGSALGA